MNYQVAEGLQIRPLSVKGRFFAFTVTPPAVLQIDAGSVMLLKLYEGGLAGDSLVGRYSELRKKDIATARAEISSRVESLVNAGLLKELPA